MERLREQGKRKWMIGCMILGALAAIAAAVIVILTLFGVVGDECKIRKPRETVVHDPDECLKVHGGVRLKYTRGSKTMFRFDLCDIIECGADQDSWRKYEVYVCNDFKVSEYCLTNVGFVSEESWCETQINTTKFTLSWSRADLYWYYGGLGVYVHLPEKWSGRCAMVRLVVPLTLVGHRPDGTQVTGPSRVQRSTDFDLTKNSPTYIEAIGVPRGVPDEYKLADQIAPGFEHLPIIGAIFPVLPHKNVDRINYVHYNTLRLANLTRDAVEGIAEQLSATSLMAFQNRMALDAVLAEKGGVCAMIQGQCCSYIPNNTAPNGSVMKALEGLRSLSKEMHEASGINNPLDGWMEKVFGKWKDVIVSIIISIVSVIAIFAFCGCCCVPCIRSLCLRVITTAVEGKPPPPYQMPLLKPDGSIALDMESDKDDDEEDYDVALKA